MKNDINDDYYLGVAVKLHSNGVLTIRKNLFSLVSVRKSFTTYYEMASFSASE